METHNQKSQVSNKKGLNYWCSRLLILPIRFYQYVISPWLGKNCRFHPTCSHYAIKSLEQHGPTKGLWLALKRMSKCHPWHQGGYDPVPLNSNTQQKMVNK